jgi:hypothetical protein
MERTTRSRRKAREPGSPGRDQHTGATTMSASRTKPADPTQDGTAHVGARSAVRRVLGSALPGRRAARRMGVLGFTWRVILVLVCLRVISWVWALLERSFPLAS